MSEPIKLFGGLRTTAAGGRARGSQGEKVKLFVEITAPDITVRLDDDRLAEVISKQVETTIQQNIKMGRDPSGKPLPRISAATEERREYRAEQAARDGKPNAKYDAKAFKDTRKNFRKRFWNPRVPGAGAGGIHRPQGGSTFSVESGMLWRSIAVARIAVGRWGLYFANARALVDDKGSSAIGRISKRIRWWSQEAMRQPNIQEALKAYAKAAVGRTQLEDLKDIGRALMQMGQRSQQIVRDLENENQRQQYR